MSKEWRPPEVLTQTECQALAEMPNPRYRTGLRDQCMIRLMLNTGLKVSECLQLRVSDIDWSSGKLNVRGRGKKARTLWMVV
jgi:integrase/recombinase XerC